MATYTMTMGEWVDGLTEDSTDLSTRDKIEQARTSIFDFDYPFYDDTKRKDFETDFIRNFFMREIGFETEGLFKFQLETWLLINMPYWNKMFESELIQYDPLKNAEMDTTNTQNDTRNTTGHSETTNNDTTDGTLTDDDFQRDLDSKQPDNRLQLTANDGEGVIEYASEIKERNTNNSRTTNQTSTGDETTDGNSTDTLASTIQRNITGKVGVQTYAEMIQKHRDIFLRIERMIFDEMNELFMMIY